MSQSRARQQVKRQRRQEKRTHKERGHFRQRLEEMRRGEAPPEVQLLSYDITEDAMPEPGHAGTRIEEVIGPEERETLFHGAQKDPQSVLPRLRQLVERHPDVPVLYNWLSVAHQSAGDYDAMDRVSELLYERHPQYLFAKLDVARKALEAGDLTRFEAILEKKFDLKLLYPWRSVFHISEYLNFSLLILEYYVRTDRDEAAEKLLLIMEEMAPDAPQTIRAREVLEHVGLLHLLHNAIELLAHPRRRRRRPKSSEV
jgi:hypothetical protein